MLRYRGSIPNWLVGPVNGCVEALRASPRLGRLVNRYLTTVTYTGRRSGRTFSTPVGYRRSGADGEVVTIVVELPEYKTWWRNFLGEGGPITLDLDGTARTGHAVADRGPKGRVNVTVRLERPVPDGPVGG